MEHEPKAREKILAAFKKAEFDLSTPEICKRAGVHKNTALKWLAVLTAEKRIEVTRQVGRLKFYRAR